jgi:hypothetical protein
MGRCPHRNGNPAASRERAGRYLLLRRASDFTEVCWRYRLRADHDPERTWATWPTASRASHPTAWLTGWHWDSLVLWRRISQYHGPRGPQPTPPGPHVAHVPCAKMPNRPGWLALGLDGRGLIMVLSNHGHHSFFTYRVPLNRPDSFHCLSEQWQPAAAAGLRLDRSGQASREGCLPGQPFLQLTRSVRQQLTFSIAAATPPATQATVTTTAQATTRRDQRRDRPTSSPTLIAPPRTSSDAGPTALP